MKTLRFPFLILTMICSFAFIVSCGNKAQEKDKTGKEYTSAYICPMHCDGSGSDKAGTCPVCKMDYVANEDAVKPEAKRAEHDHNHDHGHDHDHGHEGHNH